MYCLFALIVKQACVSRSANMLLSVSSPVIAQHPSLLSSTDAAKNDIVDKARQLQ